MFSTGYVIEKQLNTTDKWFKVATLEPSVIQYCVENLKEKSEYFIKIYAENCIGLSEPVETKLISLLTHASKYTHKTVGMVTVCYLRTLFVSLSSRTVTADRPVGSP